MALLSIVEIPDPILRERSRAVETFDAALRRLVDDMFETMYDAPGIGLAAVQVGRLDRLMTVDLQENDPDDPEGKALIRAPRLFINPVIVEVSDERSSYNEGCLSIPDQYGDVERPSRIVLEWQDIDGARQREAMDGLMATCVQHEVDHLNGVLFIDHLSRLKRGMLLKRLDKARRAL